MSDVDTHATGSDGSAVVNPGAVQGLQTLGAPGGDVGQGKPVAERQGSLWSDAWRELRRSPTFWISSAVILVFLVMAAFPALFTLRMPASARNPYDLHQWKCNLSNSLKGSSSGHPMGFDFQGCDVYAQTIYGARASISVGFLVVILATLIGATLGIVAGYYGGWVDGIISRVVDVFFGLPYVLGGIVILTILQLPGITGVVVALTALGWVGTARIARSSVISVRDADFVVAARSLGASSTRILLRHIVPNSLAPLIVISTVGLGAIVASEATFSFLGIGVQPPTISWGTLISDASGNFIQAAHPLLWPSGTLTVAVLSFIVLGDTVREALDPKLR
ncbi:oligopeptide transport system permease protein [Motilibacter rhizosphaerae]|uniref:Oligopeptide transport system permease protein n=1 Tax=Motilibacter rhizosphaerae TaxID=598652 RepID=A0A4Q7NPM9_9ACTN|nr:ABC transporter permease [Motilibacter rhizosphaerae]RZS87275.1 oligopeptide transport system permease protein [Motilibacter rhizosphaerae]